MHPEEHSRRKPLESPESSSPLITRGVAAGLNKRMLPPYNLPNWQRAGLSLLGRAPQQISRQIIPKFQAVNAISANMVENLDVRTLAKERLKDYDNTRGPFPALTIGAGLGGASAHLALSLGGPFLPQAFVVTLKGGSPDGKASTYFERSTSLATKIAQLNPDIITIQHFDPVHDEWLTRRVNHLRFKITGLIKPYQEFILANLIDGGTICYLDCGAEWLQYQIEERIVFQLGGWGDISAQEYIEGSTRIETYCQANGMQYTDWQLSGYPLIEGPESEWGSAPGLDSSIEEFCEKHGYRFHHIHLPQPHDFSRLAFAAAGRQLELEDREPAGVLIEMFSQFDPSSALLAGLLPLWLIFNTWDSLHFLESVVSALPKDVPVFFSPLSTFTLTPDLVPWSRWEVALHDFDWVNIGTRKTHYPCDPHAIANWASPLHQWVRENYDPIGSSLNADELTALVNKLT